MNANCGAIGHSADGKCPNCGNELVGEWPGKAAMAPFASWPRDPANGRLLCAPAHPMPKGAPGQWSHTNVKGDDGGSDYVDYKKCVDCGHRWGEELPE